MMDCWFSLRINAEMLVRMWSTEAGIKPARWTGESAHRN